MSEQVVLRVAGIGLVAAMVAGFVLTGALYSGALRDPAEVTLVTSRTGLVMDPGNKVKMRGVEIGRVGDITPVDDGVEIVLELDRSELDQIPSNVTAEIRATTVFGAKYVELVSRKRSADPIADGGRIVATGVTTEVNTVFKELDRVLSGVDVAGLNSTLTVLAETLQGRGDDVAELAARADAYLTKLEPLLPQMRRDLVKVAELARLGVEVSPALLRILRNATFTGSTVVQKEQAIHRLLVDLSILGGRGAEVLGTHGDALGGLLRTLRPSAATLRVYSSELPCLFKGLDRSREIMADAIGGTDSTLRALVSVRSGLPAYTYPDDLPEYPRGRGPDCHGLPVLSPDQIPVAERGGVQ